MGGIFWLFLRVLVTPEVEKTTPGGPGAALDHPPLAGLNHPKHEVNFTKVYSSAWNSVLVFLSHVR